MTTKVNGFQASDGSAYICLTDGNGNLVTAEAPSGAAGGSLGGTYPNPTVVTNANLTGAVTSVGNATSLGAFSSANLATALTDETGSGSAVFSVSPALTGTVTFALPARTPGFIQNGAPTYTAGTMGYFDSNFGALFRPLSAGASKAYQFENSVGTPLWTVTEAGAFNVAGTLTVTGNVVSGGYVQTVGYTVATLPTPSAGNKGAIAYVTDALAPSFLTIVVGGGSVITPVFCNGTNWVGG